MKLFQFVSILLQTSLLKKVSFYMNLTLKHSVELIFGKRVFVMIVFNSDNIVLDYFLLLYFFYFIVE